MNKDQLKNKGYLIFDFPDKDKLLQLHEELSKLIVQKQNPYAASQGFYITTFDSSPDFRQQINQIVSSNNLPVVKELFPGYQILMSNIILKEPGDREVPLHQDWSFVDESKFTSYELWLPLGKVTPQNGGMYLLEESHLWFKNFRSSKVNTKCAELYPELKEHLKYIDLEPGQGIIFDHRLMHYTPPNTTNINRIVLQTAFIPEAAVPLFAFQENDNSDIDLYEVDEQFFMYEDIWQRPSKYSIYKTIPSSFNEIIDIQLIKRKFKKNSGFTSFIKRLIQS